MMSIILAVLLALLGLAFYGCGFLFLWRIIELVEKDDREMEENWKEFLKRQNENTKDR